MLNEELIEVCINDISKNIIFLEEIRNRIEMSNFKNWSGYIPIIELECNRIIEIAKVLMGEVEND